MDKDPWGDEPWEDMFSGSTSLFDENDFNEIDENPCSDDWDGPNASDMALHDLLPFGPLKPDFPLDAIGLLFLDFDGVLHPETFNANQFEYLSEFEKMMSAFPQIYIVLSTSWRMESDFDSLISIFSPSFKERIIGVTPIRGDGFSDGGRGKEIRDFLWLNRIPDVPWIAVDDCKRIFRDEDLDKLFLVDGGFGLTSIDMRLLTSRLASLVNGT